MREVTTADKRGHEFEKEMGTGGFRGRKRKGEIKLKPKHTHTLTRTKHTEISVVDTQKKLYNT